MTISASFAKKASKVGSLEYNIILKMRRDFPNLTIQQEAKKEGKKGLSFGQMEDFIALHRNAKELTAKFEKVNGALFVKRHELRALENAANPDVKAVSECATEIVNLRHERRALRKELRERMFKEVFEPAIKNAGKEGK